MSRLSRFWKIVLSVITLLMVAVMLLFTLDFGFLRGTVENQVRELTGRDFSIKQGVSIKLGHDLVIDAQGLQLGNPEWAGEVAFVSVAGLRLALDPWSLWQGPPLIRQIEINDLDVSLLQNEAGQANWEFIAVGPVTEPVSDQLPFLVESIIVTNARFEIQNPRLDQPIVAVIDRLEETVEIDGLIHTILYGSLNQYPVQIEASIGPYANLLNGENMQLESSGSFGSILVSVKAEFDNIWSPLLPVIDLQVAGPDFNELTAMLGIKGLGNGDLSFNAVSSISDDVLTARINGNFGEFKLDISGEMNSLHHIANTTFHAQLSGQNFGRIARLAGLDDWPDQPFDIDTHIQRPDRALQIDQLHMVLAGASMDLSGIIPAFPEMSGAELSLRISGPDLAPFQGITGLQGFPGGAFSVTGDVMTGTDGQTSVDIQYEIPLAKGGIEGTFGSGEELMGSSFLVSANGQDASVLGEMLEITGLAAHPWSALADMTVSSPAFYEITGFEFKTYGLSVELQGRIGSEILEKDSDFHFSIKGDRLADFQALAGESAFLPAQPFSIAGQARAVPGAWELENISGSAGTTSFKLAGKLGRGESLAGSDLIIESSGIDMGRMFDLPGEARLPDGPFALLSRIKLEEERLHIGPLEVTAGQFSLKLDADLPWPPDMSRGQVEFNTSGVDITRILPELAGLKLDSGGFEILAEGSWRDGQLSIDKSSVQIGESSFSAQGKLDLPPNLSATDFQIELRSPDLSRLGTIDGVRWGTVPLHLSSSFKGTGTRFEMEHFHAQLGDSTVQGDFAINFEPEVPRFDLKLTTSALNLKPFQIGPVNEPGDTQEPEKTDSRLIPDFMFPMDILTRTEGKFEITADQMFMKRMTLQNSTLSGEVHNGGLHIDEIGTDGYKGRLSASFSLDQEPTGSLV